MEEPVEHISRKQQGRSTDSSEQDALDSAHAANANPPMQPRVFAPEEAYIVGFNVERLRKRAGISKIRFCEMLGIGRPTLDRIEDGEHDIRLSLLVKIAEALEVRAVDLMTMPQSLAGVNVRKVLGKRQAERREKGALKTSARMRKTRAATEGKRGRN